MADIRPLGPADAAAFRANRLQALYDHPLDFGSTHATEALLPLAHFEAQLAGNLVLGAFAGESLLGVAALQFRDKAKERHRAYLWGVHVRANARGGGVAGPLVDAALAAGFARVEQIELSVRVGNATAEALYRSRGFVPYGTERHSYKVDDVYSDNILMVCWRPGLAPEGTGR